MTMQAGIILGGQTPDILGAMDKGRAMAESQIGLNRQNALAELYRTQGAQIAAGDQNALNALAGFDPNASLGVQQNILGLDQTRLGMDATRLGMDQTKQQMAYLDEKTKREVADYAKQIGAEQAAAEAAELEAAVKQGMMAPTPEAFDAMMIEMGQPQLAGRFEERNMLGAKFLSMAEIMKQSATPSATEGAPKGFTWTDPANPAAGVTPLPGYTATPETVVNMGGGSDKQVFDTLAASNERAASALVGLNGLGEASKALDGGAITGFAADQRLYLAKLGSYLGITDPAAVENTETFRSAIAPQVSAMIKATVGSANISNADREFAEKAAAGSISLDEASIKRMIGVMDRMGREAIKLHNEKVDKVYPPNKGYDRERALFLLPEPSTAPEGAGKEVAPPKDVTTGNVTSSGVQWSIE